jgi:hypothetical protein
MFSCNSSFHRSMRLSPFFLIFGIETWLPNLPMPDLRWKFYGKSNTDEIIRRLMLAIDNNTQNNDIQHNNIRHNNNLHNNTQHNDIQQNDAEHNHIKHDNKWNATNTQHHYSTRNRALLCWVSQISPLFLFNYAECRYGECHYAECHRDISTALQEHLT